MQYILSFENFISVDFLAVKVEGGDVKPGICPVLIYKRALDLRISVYFHQIVPIRYQIK